MVQDVAYLTGNTQRRITVLLPEQASARDSRLECRAGRVDYPAKTASNPRTGIGLAIVGRRSASVRFASVPRPSLSRTLT